MQDHKQIEEYQEQLLDLSLELDAVVLGAGQVFEKNKAHKKRQRIEPKIRYQLSRLSAEGILDIVLDGQLKDFDFTLRHVITEKGYAVLENGDCISMLDVRAGRHNIISLPSYYDWFQAYQLHTNEKQKSIEALASFLKHAVQEDSTLWKRSELSVFDFGFGDGVVSAGFAQSVAKKHIRGPEGVLYRGVDIKPLFIEGATARVKKTGVQVEFRTGNLYRDNIEKADIVFASHVYPDDAVQFYHLLASTKADSGMIVMVYESEGYLTTFKEQINRDYGQAVLHTKVSGADAMLAVLEQLNVKVQTFPYQFTTVFPKLSEVQWQIIEQTPLGEFCAAYYLDNGFNKEALDMVYMLNFLFFYPAGGMVQPLKEMIFRRFKTLLESHSYQLQGNGLILVVS